MFSLGQRIRELRLKHGMTQIDLAKGICTPSMISQIESDRARPSYKILFSIAEKLDVALEKLLSDVDMNLEYLSTYKMARSMVADSEYASAIPLLKELVDEPRPQISTSDMMFDLAFCYLQTGQLDEADKLFAKAHDLAIVRQDHLLLGQVLLHIGTIEFQRKHHQLAAYQWQKALEEVEKLEETDLFLKANLLYNLGSVHVKLGQVQEALVFYRQSSVLYEQGGNRQEIAQSYMGIGMSYKQLGEWEQAVEYLELAIKMFESIGNELMAVKLQMSCAVIFGRTGRGEEACTLLQVTIERFQQMKEREQEGIAHVELAKLQLEKGEVQEAEESCRQARSLVPELHAYHGWINRLMGQIALQRNQREEAIRRYKAAADCFKRLEEVQDWDSMMFDLVELYDASGEMELAYDALMEIRRFSRHVLDERGIVL
ncbi:MAG: helix-turn-helix domain-containing protein [Tumebacillaceae bacterium]